MLVIDIVLIMQRLVHSYTKLQRFDYENELVHWASVWIMIFNGTFSILVQLSAKVLSYTPALLVLYNFDTFLYASSRQSCHVRS
jgi:hypothetical protein